MTTPTKNIKECFIPHAGSEGLFITCDFSQLEVCALAELTGDPVLIQELTDGVDIHRVNAALWKHCRPEEVTDKERKQAKVMTFQLQYGAGQTKIAETLGIKTLEAKDFIETFYRKYKAISTWHTELSLHKKYFPSPREKDSYEILPVELSKSPVGRAYTIKAKDTGTGDYYYPLTEMKNYPVQGFATGDLVPLVVNRIMFILDGRSKICKSIKAEERQSFELVSTVHDDFTIDLLFADDMYFVLSVIEYVFNDLKAYFKELFDYDLKLQYNYDVKIGTDFADMQKITRKEIQDILGEIKNG